MIWNILITIMQICGCLAGLLVAMVLLIGIISIVKKLIEVIKEDKDV